MFQSSGRVAFYIGQYPVMKYGITMGIAIAVSIFILMKIREKFYSEFSENTILDLTFIVIMAGITGARLWYVILNFQYFSQNLMEIIMINHGGISIQGAIVGGILAGWLYTKKNNLNFLRLADMYSLVIPIGQAIGRWGNFFNSEAFGKPCNLPWKLYIPYENRPIEFIDCQYFHPTFLYESIADICIFLFLFFNIRKYSENKDGFLFFSYLILYSSIRFIIEFIRTDSVLNIGNVPIAVIICVVFIVIGIFGLLKISKKYF
ncbi:prolipoprotein diacylglyceryl transferase [bacterium]|nr:prolipoprotein diacylglyceryl transferase [bacterium]